jgi:hypothetical protein
MARMMMALTRRTSKTSAASWRLALALNRDLSGMCEEPFHRAFDGGDVLRLREEAVFALHEHLAVFALCFAFGGEFDAFVRPDGVGRDDRRCQSPALPASHVAHLRDTTSAAQRCAWFGAAWRHP